MIFITPDSYNMADSEQMNLINQDSQFIDLLSESGCTTTLTVGFATKMP